MHRTLVVGAVVVAALAATIAVASLSSAGAVAGTLGGGGQGWSGRGPIAGLTPDIGRAQKLTFKATTLKLKFVDADGDGRQDAGDYVVFSEQLTNRSGTTIKGVDTVRCTLNVAGHGVNVVQCDGEFVLDRGEIIVSGLASPLVAVTGGTDQFSNVRGEASVDSIDPDTEIITVWLTP